MHDPFCYQNMQLGTPVTRGVAIFLAQSRPEVINVLITGGCEMGKNFSQSLDFEVSL